MPAALLRFRARRGASRARLEDAAEEYLAMLWKNGQVDGEWILSWSGPVLSAWCTPPARDSLDPRYASEWVREAREKAAAAGQGATRVTILGDSRRCRAPDWRAARSLFLMTHAFDEASPVCRGDRLRAIPVYRLPLDQVERQNLLFWAETYRKTHSLWFGSGALEAATYRELSEPARPLLREGRRWAALLEERTGKPTYTFVMRYDEPERDGAKRRCPSCGGRWRMRPGTGPLAPWDFVTFRCDRCRLASEDGA